KQASDALFLWTVEHVVLAIDVVNDLANGLERTIVLRKSFEQSLKRAAIALVCVLSLEHVKAKLASSRRVTACRNKLELRLGIDEAANQPRAGNAVHKNSFARYPCSARLDSFLGLLFCVSDALAPLGSQHRFDFLIGDSVYKLHFTNHRAAAVAFDLTKEPGEIL